MGPWTCHSLANPLPRHGIHALPTEGSDSANHTKFQEIHVGVAPLAQCPARRSADQYHLFSPFGKSASTSTLVSPWLLLHNSSAGSMRATPSGNSSPLLVRKCVASNQQKHRLMHISSALEADYAEEADHASGWSPWRTHLDCPFDLGLSFRHVQCSWLFRSTKNRSNVKYYAQIRLF
uniref:Uncharacterized protein n=1 Tax=Physcomitrium patens TaxID=3218 RepID=A0A2K1IEP5_PHYPA|nr:hypothetical protein PHYPA_029901 [Physcomitrium patens]